MLICAPEIQDNESNMKI